MSQIEKIFHSLVQSFVDQKPLLLKIRTVRSWKDCEVNNEVLSQKEVDVTKRISFAYKNTEKSFAVLVVVMCEVYKVLSRGTTCTKREIFYRDVELFKTQEKVNKAVNDLSSLLNVQEFELGVTSSSKGLVAGDLTIIVGDEHIDCSTPRAVPQNPSAITAIETEAKFVLVVEKDTVFQRLVTDEIFNRSADKPILVTGKGYPDINTRMLLKKLSVKLPIYVIVDADPHGVEILFTYKFGSMQMVHNSEHLAVPSIQWIG
jgi:meiotic recombination protein SPO11